MTRFQLIFRRDGESDKSEFRDNSVDQEPHIDGRLVVDGQTYLIRGVDWIVRREDLTVGEPRFVCTLVVQPLDTDDNITAPI